ncbi:MAG: FtsK/SpoIIIE domain-containing protein [Solirubrobacterales bacterium]
MGFEERIAAAVQETTAAALEVEALIATEGSAMTSAWTTASAEAELIEAKASAASEVLKEYEAKLKQLLAAHPDCRPDVAGAMPPVRKDLITHNPLGGWMVAAEVTGALSNDLRRARAAAREASQRFLSARPREQAQRMAGSIQVVLRTLENEVQRLGATREEVLARRDEEADSRRATADGRLREATARLAEATRRLPPAMTSWSSPSWSTWSPALTHPEVLAGMLHPEADRIPGTNRDFAWDVRIPTFVSVREPLQIAHRRGDRELAHSLARSLLLRALACTQPGKLRLAIFDPTGLGQSVSSLLDLGEYDRDLIGGKVWSSSEDLQRLLVEHTAHIEQVIQKYLRSEYATLDEFNAAAGEIAEPYRLLVILDSPAGFDRRSATELRRIVENGPRCGVATLLVTDEDLEPADELSLPALPPGLRTLRIGSPVEQVGDRRLPMPFALSPETEAQASPEAVASIVAQVGKAARETTKSAVTFEKSFRLFAQAATEGRKRGLPPLSRRVDTADSSSWWTQSTLESVAAPIGQRGARDVAVLAFDSSDHSGALLVGRPGSGKSTLLHTFIAGITTLYGPEELELHLIDFKEGVEFKVYASQALPHARTVAVESDREFGVSVLKTLEAELSRRGSLLRGSAETHSSLQSLREATGERLPRIVLVFDEFQVLFARNDQLGALAAETLETLIRQGRGFGIHVLLGSQSLAGLDALGSHVPQLLPVRILLPAAEGDAFKVLGEGNGEGVALTNAGEGILNMSGGAVEANERFTGALIEESARAARVKAMRAKADAGGFQRRPIVFEGNAPVPADLTPAEQVVDEIGRAPFATLRLRFGAPMVVSGTADVDLRRESGANAILVARDASTDLQAPNGFSLPRAVAANVIHSAIVRNASVEVIDFLPIDEGLEELAAPLLDAGAIGLGRRRQVPELLARVHDEVQRRLAEDDLSAPPILLVLYGMHRARDFDQDSIDYDAEADLPALLSEIMCDGPEVGVHAFLWFDTVKSVERRLPSRALREVSWRLAGRMSVDDSSSLLGSDAAGSLREQQLIAVNEDRATLLRCTAIDVPPADWSQDLLAATDNRSKEVVE